MIDLNLPPKKTWREREKTIETELKKLCKSNSYKFSKQIVYKLIDDIVYGFTFYTSRIDYSVSGVLEFKPIGLDEFFYDITNFTHDKGKKGAIWFNGSNVEAEIIYRYKIELNDPNFPGKELEHLLEIMDKRIVANKVTDLNNYIDFQEERFSTFDNSLNDMKQVNFIGLICALIKKGKLDRAYEINSYCIQNKVKSLFRFGRNEDFFQLTKKYFDDFKF